MKKIFILLLLYIFCTSMYAFSAVQGEAIELGDVFDNNYQNLATSRTSSRSLSAVERIFNGKESSISGNVLRQIGYDQFNSSYSSRTSITGKYDGSYRLSIGEKVTIYSYGDSVDIMAMSGSNLLPPIANTEVSSNGSLYVQGIGLIKAENRTISEIENEINSIGSRKYKNLKVRVTVASGSEFSVFVYGEVQKPGKVYISNNSSIFDALSAAGGVKKSGTLRNIKYNKKNVDLYKSLFLGEDDGIIVKPNDRIFVDKIGEVVAIKNGVTVPGIYEIKKGETVNNVVKYAGGFLATTQFAEVTMASFDRNAKQRMARNIEFEEAKNTQLASGDTIEFKELFAGVENVITIQGNIKHPATYAYKEGMRLSDILKSQDELLEETFINQAVIRRVTGKDNHIETIPVFLREFFAGMNDPVLKPKDVISIYKSTNAQFVDVYGCINTPKHLTYINNMTLKDVISDLKFMETDAQDNEDTFKASSKNGNFKLSVEAQNSIKLIPTENVAVEITSALGKTEVYYLYDILINSDKIKSIPISPEDKIFFRTLRNNETIKTVKVSGFVKEPGVYSFVKGLKLSDMLLTAGGLTDEADLRGLVFKRANLKNKQTEIAKKNNERDIKLLESRVASGYKQDPGEQKQKLDMIEKLREDNDIISEHYNGQISLNIKSNNIKRISRIDNLEIQDGDDIYVPRLSNHVSVIGEVYNEQAFVYHRGAKAKYYINEVGGYTPGANRFRIYKVGVNGRAEKIGLTTPIHPGDTIVVPRRIAGNDYITPITQTLQGLASVFLMAFAINKW